MKKHVALICLILLCGVRLHSQCISGDCKNGKGKYDYAWCVYEGSFVNGEMDGTGTIDYGAGEKYTGEFKTGKEHGKGELIHANGSREKVVFNQGTRVKETVVTSVSSNFCNGMGKVYK